MLASVPHHLECLSRSETPETVLTLTKMRGERRGAVCASRLERSVRVSSNEPDQRPAIAASGERELACKRI